MVYPNSEDLRRQRARRLEDAILCKKPDRVPFWASISYFAARYANITYHEYDFDYDKNFNAVVKTAMAFDFDMLRAGFGGVFVPFPPIFFDEEADVTPLMRLGFGTVHDILGDKYTKWAGRELEANTPSQIAYVDLPYMKTEEYDELIKDPVSFFGEKLIPRTFTGLKRLGSPKSYSTLVRLGVEVSKIMDYTEKLKVALRDLGYPQFPVLPGVFIHPLDFIADSLRGHSNLMVDLFRIPDKVMAAVDVILDLAKKKIRLSKGFWEKMPPDIKATFDSQLVTGSMPLHLNEMLSPRFFEKFFWEPLKAIVNEALKAGVIINIFFEGDFTPFLKYLTELPKASIIAYFEKTDLRKAREIIGDRLAIMGGVPASLLISGTYSKVYEETCKLLNDVKEPGGFLFSGTGVSIPNETKPENLKAAIEAVKKFGVY
ncbi:MAG: uroporphyrinogen decarboxylase family protein [Candidatus Bathyarchaeia archaeon]